ncbi:hypothetical protein T439DRAFT_379572 [Meredithblackwellia eburnea MCA 4105]
MSPPSAKRRKLSPNINNNNNNNNNTNTTSNSNTNRNGSPAPSSSSSSTASSSVIPIPIIHSSASTSTSLSARRSHHQQPPPPPATTTQAQVQPGDILSLDGYRDARVVSVHYDDIVAVRAISSHRGDQRVFLKLSLTARPSAANQFKAETMLINQLNDAGVHNITKVIARESGRLGAMMIAADDNLKLLHEIYLKDRSPAPFWSDTPNLLRTIDLAIKLIRLLASIHNLNIVHGALRPTTISQDVFSEPHIHDFSCAFRAGPDGDSNPIRERGLSEESLHYLSPECTGRVGRGADYRSDYYSLGALLYEVFTGRTPFADSHADPMEVIHAHIAKRPPLASTIDSSVPVPLAEVFAKLLEKSPEARYQTSQGLIVDLERIASLIRQSSSASSSSSVPGDSSSKPSPHDHLGPIDPALAAANFVVGSVDEAAHFRLPPRERLFGREQSVKDLLACYRRVETLQKPEVVVVQGLSGIGKTSLVEMVRKPVIHAKGFFTGVKFDQIKSPVPFFAISQALSGLFRQLLSEPEPLLVIWRRRITKALDKEGRVLAEVLPAIENIFQAGWVDTLPQIVSLGAAESEKRFQALVLRVLKVFGRHGKPLVLMFDDLQWSTPSDLSFILSLTKQENSSLLLLCLYRDNEVGPEHIVSTTLLPNLPKIDLTIKLEPLTLADVMAFVSESLRNPKVTGEDVTPTKEEPTLRGLSELILQKTLGSPLFVAQLLKALNADGVFDFDFVAKKWIYDLDLIASKSLSTDVVELLRTQMLKFPEKEQQMLRIAACIGNEETSVVTLAQAAECTVLQLAQGLHEAVEAGLIVPVGEYVTEEPKQDATLTGLAASTVPAFYRFFHDRCQQAAYSLIPQDQRSALHYKIGQNLASHLKTEEDIVEQIFDLANQLNHGIDILATNEERDRLARFNYLAGRRANKATAFEAARTYLFIAWDLLGTGGWVAQHELMCEVTEELIEVEFSMADYAASQEFVSVFLANAKDTVAKLRVYMRSLRAATATGDTMRAIEIGREGLAMAGITFPDLTEDGVAVAKAVREEISIEDAIKAMETKPKLTDPIAAGCQAILAALVPPVYFVRIDLLAALSSLALRNAVQYGLDDGGAMTLTLHAVMLSGQFKEYERSFRLGQVAIGYFERYGGSPFACPTYKVYASHVAVWSLTVRDTLASFRQAVAYGVEYRDGEYLGFGSAELSSYSLLCGVSLEEVASGLERFSVLVRKFRNELSTLYIGVVHQVALNFIGRSAHFCDIEGDAFSLDDTNIIIEKKYGITLLQYYMFRLMLSVFYGDNARAMESIKLGRESLPGAAGTLFFVVFQLFEAIVLVQMIDSASEEQKNTIKQTVELFDMLSDLQSSNFGHMRLWLQAEEARSEGQISDAVAFYDKAIEAAKQSEFVHFAACMNERCATIMETPKLAAGYLFEARSLWQTWGCIPKVAAMTATYPHLFGTPVVPSGPRTGELTPRQGTGIPSPLATVNAVSMVLASGSGSSHSGSMEKLPQTPTDESAQIELTDVDMNSAKDELSSSHTSWLHSGSVKRKMSTGSHGSNGHDGSTDSRNMAEHHLRSQLATELDLRTVVAASSVLGMETSVDGVVSKLLGLTLRTAGAELCLLVLDKGGVLCAEAIARSDSTEVKHLHRLDSIDLQPERYPCTVINYVARSRAMVVNNLDALGDAISDPYLNKHHPKSILCLALASQAKVVGVLYMENSQTANAFTPDRLEILSLISGQAASTVEKARLVQDLKSANTDLKRSQTMLEGYNRNLEGTINARTIELRDQNKRLEAEIAEKEEAQAEMRKAKDVAESATVMKSQFLVTVKIRTPFNAVVALTGLLLETPLTPVQMDYVETIKNSSHELLVVINDILDYSKIESDHLELSTEKVQLRNALESSMDMVAERAATKAVELAFVFDQEDIDVVTDLTRLRQIVVNLLSNAVKFTSNGEVTMTCSSVKANPTPDGKPMTRVTISVKDSGIGIAEKDFPKLFRVFSQVDGSETTKAFGGTGLGLAISRKLSNLMGGDITVSSVIGKGSTFTLEFVAASGEPTADPYSPAQNPDLGGKRCLIVDGHEVSRGVLQYLISSFGMAPVAPDDINLAYSIAVEAEEAGKPFDLIVLDSFLPDFAAQTLLRRLRQRGIKAPAIALTRMGSPIHDALRQFECLFLIKPIKRNRLHHTLRQVFPAGESARRTPTNEGTNGSQFPTNLAARNPLIMLCAEDNPINVKVITHLLKRMGYTTDIAEDGLVAVEKAQKKRYDLIFMDVNMPRMNGLEATRKIVELMPDKATRPYIVSMTANAMSGDKEACMEAGCDGYVSKPILVPDLVAALLEAGNKAREHNGGSASRTSSGSSALDTSATPSTIPFELELPPRRGTKKTTTASSSTTASPSRSPNQAAIDLASAPEKELKA